MVNNVEIHKASSTIILDSVSFSLDFSKATIEGGHPSGPVFCCGAAKAVVSKSDAALLVAAGVTDRR